MAESLVGEVCAWLETPAAEGLTGAERLVLLIIAERCNKTTRKMWAYKGDGKTLTDVIAARVGVEVDSLTKVFRRLALRGLEVRVPIATNSRGQPVFAVRGRSSDYILPFLPASYELPPPGKTGSPSGQ
ncbi:hypothetical protein [Streptosporangium lutulentum]|uniref:Helix-turn-helix domain-containing protein n=1 Tax=Streptosporangium lutulentum TaxID=1461250 RepID=A0ABT9Q974_9ACTN|nr:hypothetical protein [Streptosporangium lutulentum]MDP9843295.1 hypothetical protein [Streptosporangium lutulentum]